MAKKKGNSKTIALDFDGVIHRYSKGWHDGTAYDRPMKGSFDAMIKIQNKGYDIAIFSSREERPIREWFELWWPQLTKDVEMPQFEYYKKPPALYVIDDRALRFTNWRDINNYIS